MLLELDGVHASYGAVRAVQGVSIALNPGEAVTIVGANGAGKSTTLKTISGLVRPNGGSIRFEGRDLAGRPAYEVAELGIAHVPEGRRVFPELTVRENLNLGAYSKRAKPERAASMERVFALFPRLRERALAARRDHSRGRSLDRRSSARAAGSARPAGSRRPASGSPQFRCRPPRP